MPTDTYPFRIGEIDALVIADHREIMTISKFNGIFGRDDAEDIRQAFAELDAPGFGRNILHLKTPTHQLLVDTGEGAKGQLMAGLHEAGISPEQIDLLIITHLHIDHVGGLCDAAGERVFPQARVVMAQREWTERDALLATMKEERRPLIQQALEPYIRAGRFDLVEDGQEIVSGIQAVLMPGHTPGHLGLRITSGQDELLHIADTAHLPLQGQFIEATPRFDFAPQPASATRHRVFAQAATGQTLVMAYHFPFPGLGHLRQTEQGFAWQPLV